MSTEQGNAYADSRNQQQLVALDPDHLHTGSVTQNLQPPERPEQIVSVATPTNDRVS